MSMRLLLAEDDPGIQLIARLSLKKAGFDVTVVGNGAEAVRKVAEERPDVILMDWMMPEMTGLDACGILKSDVATRDIPIIFLTAKTQAAEIERGLQLGAAGYILKPFDALTLGTQVNAILRQRTEP